MPSARITMKAMTSTTNAPTATAPPSHVRRHDTCGLAFMARVTSVPCPVAEPPGVNVGVAV